MGEIKDQRLEIEVTRSTSVSKLELEYPESYRCIFLPFRIMSETYFILICSMHEFLLINSTPPYISYPPLKMHIVYQLPNSEFYGIPNCIMYTDPYRSTTTTVPTSERSTLQYIALQYPELKYSDSTVSCEERYRTCSRKQQSDPAPLQHV